MRRFGLSYYKLDNQIEIYDSFTGNLKVVNASFYDVVKAIIDSYKCDVYMLDDDATGTYIDYMLADNDIYNLVNKFIKENKGVDKND